MPAPVNDNNSEPKVALFLPSLVGGGAERNMVILANEIAETGIRVDLVVGSSQPSQYRAEVDSNVHLVLLGRERVMFCIPKLTGFLWKHRPDVLLVTMAHTAFAAKIAVALSGSRSKLFIREALAPEFRLSEIQTMAQKLEERLTRWAYRKARYVISISDEMTQSLRHFYGLKENLTTIANPVITRDFLARAAQPLEKNPPWHSDYPLVAAAGRLVEQKDFATLLDAFSLLLKQRHARLVVLGEGPLRPVLERKCQELDIAEHVWFPGFVANPLPYFRKADLFVLSSRGEGSPNTLLQALACGTRAVSTDCPTGPREILANTNLGQLVPVGDAQAMADAMHVLLAETELLSERDLSTLNKYRAENVVQAYLELLQTASR